MTTGRWSQGHVKRVGYAFHLPQLCLETLMLRPALPVWLGHGLAWGTTRRQEVLHQYLSSAVCQPPNICLVHGNQN